METHAEHPDFEFIQAEAGHTEYISPEYGRAAFPPKTSWRFKQPLDLEKLGNRLPFHRPITIDNCTYATGYLPLTDSYGSDLVAHAYADGTVELMHYKGTEGDAKALALLSPILADCAVPPTA
jgi:hypothetical protein